MERVSPQRAWLVVVVVSGCALTACHAEVLPEALGPQLEEVQKLSDDLSRQRDATTSELQLADASVQAFMNRRLVAEGTDVALLRLAMMECLTSPPLAGRKSDRGVALSGCETRSTGALRARLDALAPPERDLVEAQFRSIVSARDALKRDVPREIAAADGLYAETLSRIMEIRETADTINTAAASNPSMDKALLDTFERDYALLTERLDEMNRALKAVRRDLNTMTPDAQEALEQLTYAISVYGVEPR